MLIELLVVIAIISVLAALLFPVFSAARAKARQATCASNIRQVGVSLFMYAHDWDGMLPPATTKMPGGRFSTEWQGQVDIVWWDLVYPYLRNERVLYCPDAPPYLPTYRVNSEMTFVTPGALDACMDPSRTLMLLDGQVPNEEGERLNIPALGAAAHPLIDECMYHHGKCQVCFADGHVKLLTMAQLEDPSLWSID